MPRGLNPKQRQEAAAAGAKAAPGGGGGLNIPPFDPSAFAGAGGGTGVHKLTPKDIATMKANEAAQRAAGLTGPTPLSPRDIATMQGNAAAQMAAGLTGPFTPEAVASGYNSTVAGLYGTNYPKAQQFVALAQRHRWDQATFERWLRSRPEFAATSVGQKMRADAITVVAQLMGVI